MTMLSPVLPFAKLLKSHLLTRDGFLSGNLQNSYLVLSIFIAIKPRVDRKQNAPAHFDTV